MKPLFDSGAPAGTIPVFAYGQLLQGQPLAWPFAGSFPVAAQLRGRLWRLPSGTVLLSTDPTAGWVLGELHPQPRAATLRIVSDLLIAPEIEPAWVELRARVGTQAKLVQVWAAPAEQLRRVGAHPLRGGNWRRMAPR